MSGPHPNFTLTTLADGHYRVKARNTTKGVIDQIKRLLKGKEIRVNGKLARGKKHALSMVLQGLADGVQIMTKGFKTKRTEYRK